LTASFDGYNNGYGLYVLTIDTNGDVLSGKRFSGEYHNPHACMVDLAGDVVIVGTVGTDYGTFTKISKQGDLIFFKKVEFGINYDEIWDVLQTPDSSYYLIAEPESYINQSQVGILKFDKAGNFLWMKIYGGGHGSFPFNGVLNADSTITVAGTLHSYWGPGDLWLLKVDAEGNSSCAAKSEIPEITDIALIADSGYTLDSIVPFGNLTFSQQLYSTQSYDVCDTIALTLNFIQKNDDHLELPTLFSPNALNPVWQIMNGQGVHSINIILSDIYGRIIFHSSDPQFEWDGTADGIAVSSGMYCWIALVIFDNSNERKMLSGKLMLVK
jgi:gliding motility-associated-like protein